MNQGIYPNVIMQLIMEPEEFTINSKNTPSGYFLINFKTKLQILTNSYKLKLIIILQIHTNSKLTKIQKINLNAPILLTKALLKKKKIKKGGSIVFTASAAGVYRVSMGNAIYATTKCGIDAFMRTVALEYGPKGIRCNSINPGMVETALIEGFTEEQKEKEMQNYPLRRFAKPEDIAQGIVYLLSDAASFVTGTALKIDGGMTLS